MENLTKFFDKFKSRQEPAQEPHIAQLPNNEVIGEGSLDASSPTWVFIAAHCNRRITELRELNDSLSLGDIETAHIRGKIKECKKLLDLAKPAIEIEPEEDEEDGHHGFGRRPSLSIVDQI